MPVNPACGGGRGGWMALGAASLIVPIQKG